MLNGGNSLLLYAGAAGTSYLEIADLTGRGAAAKTPSAGV